MNYKDFGIHDLRTYAREVGVSAPTLKKRADLIEEIELIETGKKAPQKRSTKGRPVKKSILNNKDIKSYSGVYMQILQEIAIIDKSLEKIQKYIEADK